MRTFQLLLEKRLIICFFLFFVLLIQGCASDDAMNTDAPDIEATITAAIAKSLPAPVATGNSTLESEIKFRVQATIAAQSVSPVSPKTDSK